MDNTKRTNPKFLFYRIESRANAETACRQGGGILLVVGVLQILAVLYDFDLNGRPPNFVHFLPLLFGALVFKRKSRTAAVLAVALVSFFAIAFVVVFYGTLRIDFGHNPIQLGTVFFAGLLALGGGLRSVQGTFIYYRRFATTSVRWPKLVQLWILVVVYTVMASGLVAGSAVLLSPDSEPYTSARVAGFLVIFSMCVFFFGCLRWLPFTRKLAVLRNETDELDALPF